MAPRDLTPADLADIDEELIESELQGVVTVLLSDGTVLQVQPSPLRDLAAFEESLNLESLNREKW